MTYWQAYDLQELAGCGEFQRKGNQWVQVFGRPGKYDPIDNRRMQWFIKHGFVRLEPMITQPDLIVARCTMKGLKARVAYFRRYYSEQHRRLQKLWKDADNE